MAVSDWVPIASVAATAVVALGVPIITARFDLRKIRAQADEARLDELRGVIDEASAALRTAIAALDQAKVELIRRRLDETRGKERSLDDLDWLERYSVAVEALSGWESRLAVRVSPGDPLHATYAHAIEQLNNAMPLLTEVSSANRMTHAVSSSWRTPRGMRRGVSTALRRSASACHPSRVAD